MDSTSTSDLSEKSEKSEDPGPKVVPFTPAAGFTTCPKNAELTQSSPTPRPAVLSESPRDSCLPNTSARQASDDVSSLDGLHSSVTEKSDVAMEEEADGEASSRDFTPGVLMLQPRVSIKKPRTKTSHIHDHISTQGDSFICNSCSRSYKISGGTGAIARHLKKFHSITPTASGLAGKRTQERSLFDDTGARRANIDHNIQGKRTKEVMGDGLDQNTLEYLYLKWTISQEIPLENVEHEGFRTFLEYVNPVANRMLPNSESTMKIRAEILLAGEDYKLTDHVTS